MEKKIIDSKVTLGLFYNQMFQHVEAKEAVEPIIELALERNYKRRISQINTIMVLLFYDRRGLPYGLSLSGRGLRNCGRIGG